MLGGSNGDFVNRRRLATVTSFVLAVSTLTAQPVKKAEYRTADGRWTGVCGYYDVQPRDGSHAVVVIPETTTCPDARSERYDATASTKKRAASTIEIDAYDAEQATTAMRRDLWQLRSRDVSISAAQVQALRGSPKTLVTAPGAGYALEFVSAAIRLTYVAPVYTATAGDNLVVRYADGAGIQVSEVFDVTGFITAASGRAHKIGAKHGARIMPNAPLVLHNVGLLGYALGNSTLTLRVFYIVHQI